MSAGRTERRMKAALCGAGCYPAADWQSACRGLTCSRTSRCLLLAFRLARSGAWATFETAGSICFGREKFEARVREALLGEPLTYVAQSPGATPIRLNYQYPSLSQSVVAWEAISGRSIWPRMCQRICLIRNRTDYSPASRQVVRRAPRSSRKPVDGPNSNFQDRVSWLHFGSRAFCGS